MMDTTELLNPSWELNKTEPTSPDQILSQIDNLVEEKDNAKRKLKVDEFVSQRLDILTKNSTPKNISMVSSGINEGFIHPESVIKRAEYFDGFKVDDPEIYKMLIESFREFKQKDEWKNVPTRQIVSYAINYTLGNYFGNWFSTTENENNNSRFHLERMSAFSPPISLSEFRNQHMGVCVEKAASAQNLLTFMGYSANLIISSENKISSQDSYDISGHAYNVISSENGHFIYDPSNPVLTWKNDAVEIVSPANYRITEQQFNELLGGGEVGVNHQNFYFDGQKYLKTTSILRTYGGPKRYNP